MTLPAPNACRWCGIEQGRHGEAHSEAVGWHVWTPPTDVQILDRMLARRERRRGWGRPPNACRWCGIEDRSHAGRWNRVVGWHQWCAPGDVQRLERMRARRDERLGAKLRRLRKIPASNIAMREAVMAPEPANPFRVNTNGA